MAKENNNNSSPKKPKFSSYWIYGAILVFIIGLQFFSGGSSWQTPPDITPAKLQEFLKDGDVSKVEIITNIRQARVYLTKEAQDKEIHKKTADKSIIPSTSQVPQYILNYGDLQNFENDIKKTITEDNLSTSVGYDTESNAFGDLLLSLLPFVLIIGIWLFLMRRMSGGGAGGAGGQIFNIGKSKARLFDEKTDMKVTFKDVAGLEGAKEEVQEIVDFLKNPEKYTSLGGKIPKGALLVGSPGTGKTLLAKAVAGEAKVPFFSLSGSDFVEMFVGVGASKLKINLRQLSLLMRLMQSEELEEKII